MLPLWLEDQKSPPWILRVYAASPLPPFAVGTLLCVLYIAAVAAYFALIGGHEGLTPQGDPIAGLRFWQVSGWWTLIVNAVLIGFAPTVMVHTLRSVEEDVRALAPALGIEADADAVAVTSRTVVRLSPWTMRLVGLCTVGVMVALTFLDPGLWRDRARPSATDPFFIWFLVQQALIGWLWARTVVADVSTARAFGRLSEQVRNVDLLDLRPLGVFARRGVRSVVYWMIGLAIFSLFWLGPNAGRTNIVSFVVMIALAGTNLGMLVSGGRRRVHVQKERELERIRDAIRRDQRALLESPGDGAAAARLPALFAAEARVSSVGELAFDTTTALRFALYVSLGVGSWVGGALIERLLGAALD